MNEYLDILKSWERRVADPFIFEHLCELLPAWGFRRMNQGTPQDRWVSPVKMDLSKPKKPNPMKTVVSAMDMKMREQGDWNNPVSVADILMKEKGFDNVYQLYSWLSERYHLDMPMPDSPKVKIAERRKARRATLLEDLMEYFCWCLANSSTEKAQKTRSYLKRERGFTQEQIEKLRFGFVPLWSSVVTFMTTKKKYLKEELDEACGVYSVDGKTAVGKTHTLAIPYICAGVLKGFLFRRVDSDDKPKYLANFALDRRSVFFNYPEQGSSVIAVVEGEMDALTATAAGIPGVVAIGGSEIAGERKHQVEVALASGTRSIILCPDLDSTTTEDGTVVPDHAKRLKAVMHSVHTIKDIDIEFDSIYVTVFDEPTDPDEFIRKRGGDAFIKLLRDALPWWEYVYNVKSKR